MLAGVSAIFRINAEATSWCIRTATRRAASISSACARPERAASGSLPAPVLGHPQGRIGELQAAFARAI
jgi:hypothetical protein